MQDRLLLTAEEVAALLNCSVSYAYVIIRRANKDLASRGYIVLNGRIPRGYLIEKIYGAAEIMKGGEAV